MRGNKFLVGAQGDNIISLKLGFQLSEEEALNLAAMIVAIISDDEKWEKALEEARGCDE